MTFAHELDEDFHKKFPPSSKASTEEKARAALRIVAENSRVLRVAMATVSQYEANLHSGVVGGNLSSDLRSNLARYFSGEDLEAVCGVSQ